MAARLVGPHGHVHCIDIDGDALEIARGRCRSAGHDEEQGHSLGIGLAGYVEANTDLHTAFVRSLF
jgi:hypothetical protein